MVNGAEARVFRWDFDDLALRASSPMEASRDGSAWLSAGGQNHNQTIKLGEFQGLPQKPPKTIKNVQKQSPNNQKSIKNHENGVPARPPDPIFMVFD